MSCSEEYADCMILFSWFVERSQAKAALILTLEYVHFLIVLRTKKMESCEEQSKPASFSALSLWNCLGQQAGF